MAISIINPERQAKKKEMAELGFTSGKSYKRRMKALRRVRPQYYKNGALVPTKRARIENTISIDSAI